MVLETMLKLPTLHLQEPIVGFHSANVNGFSTGTYTVSGRQYRDPVASNDGATVGMVKLSLLI